MRRAVDSTRGAGWPDRLDGILGGDQAVALALVTPASGVALMPVTNFALRDRDRGMVAVNSSVGMWRKLQRIASNPRVALAFHTREHSLSDRPEYLLVHGDASIVGLDDPHAWEATVGEAWQRFGGQPRHLGRFWEWWLRDYHARVDIEIAVERIVEWPGLRCDGEPAVHGAALPTAPPPSQSAPARGAGPRIDPARAAKDAAKLPHVLLGWAGGDGYPMVVAAEVTGARKSGLILRAPQGFPPPGARRAGLLAHWFSRHVVGQRQRKHTGWMRLGPGGQVIYAPHTAASYDLPARRLLYNLGAGWVTRRGRREGRKVGFLA
jgi:hypothetical protein